MVRGLRRFASPRGRRRREGGESKRGLIRGRDEWLEDDGKRMEGGERLVYDCMAQVSSWAKVRQGIKHKYATRKERERRRPVSDG